MINAGTAATLLVNSSQDSVGRAAGLARIAALNSKPKMMTEAQMDAVAKDFESMFITQMLEQMFGDSLGSELFGSDESKEIYKSMMMDEYGKQMTRAGGIGIASYVKRELLALQEIAT